MILSMNSDYYPKQLLVTGLSNTLQNVFCPRYETNLHIFYSLVLESVAGSSMQAVFFNPWSVRVRLEVDNVALVQVLIRVCLFYLSSVIPPKLPTHFIHTSLLPAGQRGKT